MLRLLRGIALSCLCLLFVSPAFADLIPVNNPTFAVLPSTGLYNSCGTGCAWSGGGNIPGWTSSNQNAGIFQPGTQVGNDTYFSSLSDGDTSAFSNGGTISQTVGVTVQDGVTYTLQVDLGNRNDLPFDASAGLLVGNEFIPATGVDPTDGNWSTFTATFVGLPSEVGDSITIDLISSGTQGNFDNVRLSETVPEPSSLLLLGIGLLAVGLLPRRRVQPV